MLSFKIYSLFPEIFPGSLQHGLIGKAYKNKVWDFQTIQIRDYSNYSGNSVDDKPFSGGAGMVLRPDVISDAIEKTTSRSFGISSPQVVASSADVPPASLQDTAAPSIPP